MFHVTADDAFPYRLCGGQQESGSACVLSRGQDGAITFRDWHPAAVEEYGYAAPDPRDPDVVYGGKISRWDRRTGQVQDITPVPLREPGYRVIRTQPVLFSPTDPRTLFFASNTVWKTRDGGRSWQQISPDLTRATWQVPQSVGKYRGSEEAKPRRRGVVYALAPSPRDAKVIWAGSDDGLIHLTRDGGAHWQDVTPADLLPWAKVSHPRGQPLRRAGGVRGGEHAPAGRPAPPHPAHARRREELAGDRARAARGRHRQRGARGSRCARACSSAAPSRRST